MIRSLLVTPIHTASALTGGGQRTLHVYQALARLGRVDIALVSEAVYVSLERNMPAFAAEFPSADEIVIVRSTEQFIMAPSQTAGFFEALHYHGRRLLHAMRPRSHFYEPSPAAKQTLAGLLSAKSYDVIVGRYLQATALSGALSQDRVPVVIDLDDLDEAVLRSRLRSPTTSTVRRCTLALQLWQLSPLLRRLRTKARHVLTATSADRDAVGQRASTVLPNIPFRHKGFAPSDVETSSRVVLFVGTYGHRVNREGVRHFIENCWPDIRKREPGARFRIVGSGGWNHERAALEQTHGVEVVGTVDDLQGEYAAAALCVAPLFEGSGTKIKILEALMHGRAVVAAAHSARGFEELIDNGVFAVTSDGAMADACAELLRRPERRSPASLRGQRLVADRYSEESVFRSMKQALTHAAVLPA